MKLAVVHSFYRPSRPSGENELVRAEVQALRQVGFDVALFSVTSPEKLGVPGLVRTAARVAAGYGRHPLHQLRDFAPDVVHIHNTFPGYARRWVRRARPFVATVHNYRFACANGTLQRGGGECRLCLTGSPVPGLRHGCYQGSRAATLPLALAAMQRDPVLEHASMLLTPSERLARDLTAARPYCAGRTVPYPPFLPDALLPDAPLPAVTGRSARRSGGAWLFVGRLSPEKGLHELLRRWPAKERLTVIGDGPDRHRCTALARSRRLQVTFAGPMPRQLVIQRIAGSLGVVVASLAPETFGLNYLEALAVGRPVVARRGTTPAGMAEAEGTGRSYADQGELAEALERVRLGEFAADHLREVFHRRYSQTSFVRRARGIYARAGAVTA